ncbi:T9SS type B sorting domain-containing protein [Flagellimonas beolgyonensis]|uniref:T9SS type B sorting domain-containing protein n=1 Tax=Flagellimonas beolgyonensis TaxID=864064 RepID=UPI0013DFB37D|nr:T9SS type B sorting domain-containing protein [Allomuricauda beolgyonensis]
MGQQVDTWLTADRAVNSPPIPYVTDAPDFSSKLWLFTPLAPADGTIVNIWYDFVDFTAQDAIQNPIGPLNQTFPNGFDYAWPNSGSYAKFLSPDGSYPGLPVLRRNQMNFNPVIRFDGTFDGQALVFKSDSREEITVFIVFKAMGAGNSAETQRLLFGGDVNTHHESFNSEDWLTNLSIGVSDGNRFSVGRTWSGDNGTGYFQNGSIDLMGRTTIGMLKRKVAVDSETLSTKVNGLADISSNRAHALADNDLFFFNRLGKHFNSNDSNRNLTGDIAEVLLADGPLDDNSIQRIESYLGIKYGITLNNSGGQLGSLVGNLGYNYLAADGTIIWDTAINSNYRFDIAGLGRDRYEDFDGGDNSTSYDDKKLRYNLHQRISKSENSEAVVTMSTNSDFSSDNLETTRPIIDNTTWVGESVTTTSYLHNYLLWGNDRNSLNQVATELPPQFVSRIEREWQIQKTVSPGGVDPIQNVSVRIDLSGSDILDNGNCGNVSLIIDTDGDGNFLTGPITAIPATSVDVSKNAYFDNVIFEHLDVFTVAFVDTIPPTASNPLTETVCDAPPFPDPTVVTDEADNCAVDTVTFIGDVSDGLTNPETITRTYRITDIYGNYTDVQQTIYVFITPNIDPIADVDACDSYFLPPITGTNLSGNEAYYDLSGGPSGGGNKYNPGDEITSTVTLYIYDEIGGISSVCSDEEKFTVTINNTPVVDAPADVTACDSYILPALANGNYFDAPNGGGNPLFAGDAITVSTTLYVYSETATTPNCSAESSFTVTINNTTNAGDDGILVICEASSFNETDLFAQLGGTPDTGGTWSPALSGAGVYTYTVSSLAPCNNVTSTVTVYEQEMPQVDNLNDVEVCGQYILPSLTHGNYFTEPEGAGTQLFAGDSITQSTTVFIYNPGTTSCPNAESSFNINVTSFGITTTVQNETCWGNSDGFVEVVAATLELPINVQLNSTAPSLYSDNSFTIDGLAPGNYVMTLIDNGGCQSTTAFEIEAGGPNLNASVEPIYSCNDGLPSNSINVILEDPTVANDVLYAIDSSNPNDFALDPNFENIGSGNHTLHILHTNGCFSEIPFSIETTAPLNLTLLNEYANQITGMASGGFPPYTYYFEDNSGSHENTYTIDHSGTFDVRVVDSNGCEAIASIALNFVDLDIPNFFTPNNDGQNDYWKPRNMELFPDIETYIFDRYGRKIKVLGPVDNGWDGTYESKPLPSGDYWYTVKLNDGSKREFVGHFTLYR